MTEALLMSAYTGMQAAQKLILHGGIRDIPSALRVTAGTTEAYSHSVTVVAAVLSLARDRWLAVDEHDPAEHAAEVIRWIIDEDEPDCQHRADMIGAALAVVWLQISTARRSAAVPQPG